MTMRFPGLKLVGLLVLALVTSCTPSEEKQSRPSGQSAITPSQTQEPEPAADVVIREVSVDEWDEMKAADVWRQGCPLGRRDLRRVEVNHWRFDGTLGRGALVVNRDVAQVVGEIFARLFDNRFPIRQMVPLEHYQGDANASMRDDNTSAFNCRRPDQINAPPLASPHANGRAVDINPRENPWTDLRCQCWIPSPRGKAREPGPGVILRGGLVWRLFTRAGWIWQNIKVPDYMHFDTGYPSRPYRAP